MRCLNEFDPQVTDIENGNTSLIGANEAILIVFAEVFFLAYVHCIHRAPKCHVSTRTSHHELPN